MTVNLEQVYEWNPGVIFMTNFNTAQPEDLYNNTVGTYDWSGIQAVQDQRVYKMPLGMYRSYTPGIDTPITLLWMAKTVYPALFEDIDVTQRAIDYYQDGLRRDAHGRAGRADFRAHLRRRHPLFLIRYISC